MANTTNKTEQEEDVTSWIEKDPATILVCGSRKWKKAGMVNKRVGALRRLHDGPITIVTAQSEGAEKFARAAAVDMSLTVVDVVAPVLGSLKLKANREQLQQIRNRAMVAIRTNAILAFWDGESVGTKQIIDLANERKRQGRVFFPDESNVALADVEEGLAAYREWKASEIELEESRRSRGIQAGGAGLKRSRERAGRG